MSVSELLQQQQQQQQQQQHEHREHQLYSDDANVASPPPCPGGSQGEQLVTGASVGASVASQLFGSCDSMNMHNDLFSNQQQLRAEAEAGVEKEEDKQHTSTVDHLETEEDREVSE